MSNIPVTSAYYVTCHDQYMSNWGPAEGKKNVLVFLCHSHDEAEIVAHNARKRKEMAYIKVHALYPERIINNAGYYVELKSREDMPNWYKPNAIFFGK